MHVPCERGVQMPPFERSRGGYANEAILDRMADRLAMSSEVMDQRRESVEHPFGSIKQWMGQRDFLTRRIENITGEFNLKALAYNIRRALTLVGVAGLMRATSAQSRFLSTSSGQTRPPKLAEKQFSRVWVAQTVKRA
jgi:hypothetical protein